MTIREKIIKGLLAAGLTSSLAVGGFFLTASSEAPKGVPILSAYLDTGGIPTVCLGSTRDIRGNKIPRGLVLTEDGCVDLFVKDYVEHYNLMKKYYKGEFKSGWQEAAITDFVFHKGAGAFSTSTLLKRLKANRHEEACQELMKWVYGRDRQGNKVVIKGLVNRASAEMKWCMGDVPADLYYIKKQVDEGKF